ncbi:MAG: DUF58 domain-containing protein [Candidatus Schekmanbacteria bacterium]|nr:DUF58 domain-containing protein [Candidatus Schekmanbacteria bacterium]
MPTDLLVSGAVVLGVLALVMPFAGWLRAAWWLCAGGAAIAAALDGVRRPARSAVTVRRRLERLYYVGRESQYAVIVRNESDAILSVSVRDVASAALRTAGLDAACVLAPGAERAFAVSFVGLDRGAHALAPAGVRVQHPWGLLAFQDVLATGETVTIAPGRPPRETAWLLAHVATLSETGDRRTRQRGSDQELESLREYVAGDEIRKIDWKASARRNRPQLRQYQAERAAELMIALDCGRLMGNLIDGVSKLDLAMTPVLDLAAVALRRHERVGLLVFDSRPRVYLPPRGGVAHLHEIVVALAELAAENEPTSYLRAVRHLEAKHRKRCLVICLTDFTDELSAGEMYASLAALTRRHVLLFAAVSDPHLEAIFADEATDEKSLFERAVAGQLLLERRRTLARLERLGVLTVDAEPQRLSGPLLRRYLEARRGGRL